MESSAPFSDEVFRSIAPSHPSVAYSDVAGAAAEHVIPPIASENVPRQGSTSSENNNADKMRPGSASKGNAVPGDATPQKKPAPQRNLSELSPQIVIAEIELRILRLQQEDDWSKPSQMDLDDLDYLKAVTRYGKHRSSDRILLIKRMTELKLVEIFRKIHQVYVPLGKLQKVTRDILIILWNGTDSTKELCQDVLDSNLCEDILGYMDSDLYDLKNLSGNRFRIYWLKGLMGIINNTLRMADNAQGILREQNAIKIFQKFQQSDDDMVRCKTEILLSYVMTEAEYEEMDTDHTSIKFMLKLLDNALVSPDHQSKKWGFSADEVMEALNRVAVSDSNKPKIVEHGCLPLYVKLMDSECTRQEHYHTARGFWLLAFKCKDRILQEEGCLEGLTRLSESSEFEDVKKMARGALWILQGKDKDAHDAAGTEEDDEEDNTPHVFISYQWASQEVMLRVRDQLIQAGYKVWMDVDAMTGSILEAMALAVEKAAVVIICMSQKYKESPNCRTEAEYTFRQRKEIVPLRLQSKYLADGWLGALVGNKLFFDFSITAKYERSLAGLVKELGDRGKTRAALRSISQTDSPAIVPTVVNPLLHAVAYSNQTGAATWGVEQVTAWLRRINLSEETSWFEDVDGAMLLELKDLHRDAPEYYYTACQKQLGLSLKSTLRFTKQLKQLV